MQLEIRTHEKIRFRRDEISDLDALPSAVSEPALDALPSAAGEPALRAPRKPLFSGVFRIALQTIAVLILLMVAGIGLVYAIAASGIGTERLRLQAEATMKRALGPGFEAEIGPTGISLDSSRFLAFDVRDVNITSKGARGIEAGKLQFGIRMLPLLSGDFKLGTAKLSDGRISVAALRQGGDWTGVLRNQDGLIDPDIAGEALFRAMHSAFLAIQRGGTQRIDLERTEIVLADHGRIRSLFVTDATLEDDGAGAVTLAAKGTLDGRDITLTGNARHDPKFDRIADLTLDLTIAAPEALKPDAAGLLSKDGGKSRLGAATIRITGAEGYGGGQSRLVLTSKFEDYAVDLGKRGFVLGDGDLNATLTIGANKLEIDRLLLSTGRSKFDLSGAIGPQPLAADERGAPSYRYELVTNKAHLSPLDSPEAAIDFSARLAGRYDDGARKLSADELTIRTGRGELVGVAGAEFVTGKMPGLSLTLSARDMPVAQLKQFWPWIAAGRARQWALENFFGGTVVAGELRYGIAPGRIGDGVPLNADEISGHFEVANSRFDTTGSLPPIRDAYGRVDFRGNDVDVALSRGTAYLPSGKQIAVSNGTLKLRNAHLPPVIGDLDLDISGDAEAAAELASFKPIDALRRINLASTDFSGQVSGHVTSQVPLQKGADLGAIEWRVEMDFDDLAIAQPFDGQKVSAAKGKLIIDPRHADIIADAQLNGIPAKLKIIEPFREEGPERQRDIALTIDNQRRSKLAPGLDGLIDGTMILKVDASNRDAGNIVEADLTKAALTLPWVGWSKGPGVPASLDFKLKSDGVASTLSDFKLSGKSFEIDGSLTLRGGGLASARFDTVRLNRGDAARIDVTRKGKSYNVTVRGDAFDARGLIKLILGNGSGKGGGKANSVPVSVKASLGKLAGFNDETLSNVELTYRSSGAGSYDVSAVTDRGGAVTIRNGDEGGQQTMRVQSADAGSLVRFLDIYDFMQGGQVEMALRGEAGGSMRGQISASDFFIVGEARLGSIVGDKPDGSDRSLNQAVKRDIDTSRVQFQRAYAQIERGDGYLKIGDGVVRGTTIGATFQGRLYDKAGNIDMTGTFMPAYGLNRLFGELPIIGAILGNGRDRGLIGVTFKLDGKASKPNLQINPLSVIAPGIFRQIFEFQ